MDLMGADFDGDTIAIARVPKDSDVLQEVRDRIGTTIGRHARWSAEFLMFDSRTTVRWDTPEEDVENRLQYDGYLYSISPEDMLDPDKSETLCTMKESGCKEPPVDLSHYARGVPRKSFADTTQDIVAMTTRMKVELGVVGSLTDMITHAIYAVRPDLLRVALMLKEAVTQALLDSKHGTDSFDTFKVSDVFKRQNEWHSEHQAPVDDAVACLVSHGLNVELVQPTIEVLWPLGEGVSAIIDEHMPVLMVTRRALRRFVLAFKDQRTDKGFMGRLLMVHHIAEEGEAPHANH
jgi:hypothetical protein